MPSGPRLADVPRLRTALKYYRVSAAITGVFLLLLVVMMVFRYGFNVDIEMGGPFGFLALTAKEQITAINLSIVILAAHGWFYVLYLACDFVMWRLARYSFTQFLIIAAAGVVPFLSFYFEIYVPRYINGRIANTLAAQPAEEVPA